MPEPLKISLIIPSLGRSESLQTCLASIYKGSYVPHEIILITEEGELAQLRNKGASQATGDILTFIDDDVEVTEGWLQAIADSFERPDIVGVSGPSIVRESFRVQRDIFRWKWIKALYDCLFLEGRADRPGLITKAGTWTTGACEEDCQYEGTVDYLEACNMSFRKEAFKEIGGFDERFRGIGDWSEPDASFRIKTKGRLYFSAKAKLYHNPSRTGAFHKRKRTGARLSNYYYFSKKWITPHWRHTLYKWFLNGYYGLKEMGIV